MRRWFPFAVLCLFCVLSLTGCTPSSKYQAVDLSSLEPTEKARTGESEEPSPAAARAAVEPFGMQAGLDTEPEALAEPESESESGSAPDDAGASVSEETLAPETPAEKLSNGHTVAVDAGRQAKANTEKEPIGPSSETMKAKMSEGSTGTATGVPEYELTLAVAKKLETELAVRGYEVVMVRNSNDVNLSNAERAEIANESGAEIFIRLQANVMENSGVYGALTMCMTAQNPYNAGLHDKSYTLSKKIVDSICAQTGTKNRGVQEVDNSGAINWSQIPVSVVRLGFLSNPDEDRWMQNEDYQGKIVKGIADAVDSYFGEGN
ncbi:MAG: N-acetylmuramoyl-L-alanine amidase [Lachnospiraceae bacterium]|nr:N-acetylmuramoyl-L-alanine amidase [Lachnospiraceae bacterium]